MENQIALSKSQVWISFEIFKIVLNKL